MSSEEYKWKVRKGNTGRFSINYAQQDGTVIPLTGAIADLIVYEGDVAFLTKDCNIWAAQGQIDVFLDVAEINSFAFESSFYEVVVTFSNGDVDTFVDGPIVVTSGRGPFV